MLLFGLACFALAYLCLVLPRGMGRIAPIWLLNGFALGILFLSRRRRWSACIATVGLANLLANVAIGDPLPVAAALATCNAFEVALAALLLRRVLGRSPDMTRPENLLRYGLACVISVVASGSLAATVLRLLGQASAFDTFFIWTLADLAGLLVVTPCVVTLGAEGPRLSRLLSRESWPLLILGAVASLAFLQDKVPLKYLVVTALILVSWRMRLAGAAAAVILTLSIAIAGSLLGVGPFGAPAHDLWLDIASLQLFLAICFYVSLPVTAQRMRAEHLQSEVERALTEAREAEARYRLIAERAHDIIVRATLDGVIHYISPSCSALGYRPDELIGRSGSELVHPDDLPRYLENTARLIAHDPVDDVRERRHRYCRPDGSYVWLEGNPTVLRDEKGSPAELLNVFRDITERVEAEDILARNEAKYRLLADNITDIIACYGRDGVLTFVSPAVQEVLGYSPEELVGHAISELMHPDDLGPCGELFRASLAAGPSAPPFRFEYRMHRKDGALVRLEAQPRAIYNDAGHFVQWQDVVRDVTERRAMEAALAESELRYRTLADNATDILVRFGPDGLIRYISPACRRLGVDPQTAVGESILKLIAPEHAPYSQAIVAQLFSGADVDPSIRREHRITTPDGREVWLEGSPTLLRDDTGAVTEVITVLRDITERRRAETELAAREVQFRQLTENSSDVIARCDLHGRVLYVSPATERVSGFTPEEHLGMPAGTNIHPDDRPLVGATFQQVIATKCTEGLPVEYRAFRKDGSLMWCEARPVALLDPGTGECVGVTDVVRDITVRKALEADLTTAKEQAESAAKVKSEFLANMSHELRTPLTSVVGFAKLVSEQPELSDLTRGYVDRVNDAGRALLATVNDILDFSKLEAGQVTLTPTPVRLAKVLRGALSLFEPQAGAKDLDLTLAADLPDDFCALLDEDRLRQVLLNLLGNAVKFTTAGSVTLRAGLTPSADRLRLEVVDTGAGIAPDKMALLFQRFSQVDGSLKRAHGGTGLGLAICKGIVEAMGGEIGATSSVGEGSCFWVSLPVVSIAADHVFEEAGVTHEDLAFSGVRVLVVDDHAANRELAQLFLAGVGAEITEAADGEEAVELALTWPYDVILMDLRMPKLDGLGALEKLRSQHGPNDSTPVLAFTADADAETALRLRTFGFQGVVAKPLAPHELIAAIATATYFEPTTDTESCLAG